MDSSVFSLPSERRQVGRDGESLACVYLQERGYTIIAKNITYKGGEIDIVATKDGYWHFIEVKYRRSLRFGYPEESMTYTKRKRLYRAVLLYLQKATRRIYRYRVDVLAILALPKAEIRYTFFEGIELN